MHGNPLSIRLPADVEQRLRDHAAGQDRSVNYVVCQLLADALGLSKPHAKATRQAKQMNDPQPLQAG
jgi:predicted transcriptional regulator